jgi:hypothetical protein
MIMQPDLANLLLEHGATGAAYAWELQFRAEKKQSGL